MHFFYWYDHFKKQFNVPYNEAVCNGCKGIVQLSAETQTNSSGMNKWSHETNPKYDKGDGLT